MLTTTTEPIEAAILFVAVAALLVSLWLCGRAIGVYRAAVATGACDVVRLLAWMRCRNEAGRVAIEVGVIYAGYVNAATAQPASPSENYWIFRGIWLVIALICLSKSLLNGRDTHRAVGIIERERAAGRMQGHAEETRGGDQ